MIFNFPRRGTGLGKGLRGLPIPPKNFLKKIFSRFPTENFRELGFGGGKPIISTLIIRNGPKTIGEEGDFFPNG